MLYIYTDESGDLGFDMTHKKSSRFFTMTLLLVKGYDANRQLIKAAKKTLARKLNPRKNRKRLVQELKGTQTTLSVKQFLYEQIATTVQPKLEIYAITINKQHVYQTLHGHQERLYNWLAGQLLSRIGLNGSSHDFVELVMDRCKGKPGIVDFNNYIQTQLVSRINPLIPLTISHRNSKESYGLQVCDMFSWGIWQTYEHGKNDWYVVFSDLVLCNEEIFQNKKSPFGEHAL